MNVEPQLIPIDVICRLNACLQRNDKDYDGHAGRELSV